jgi:hypothetical protein
MTTAIAKQKDLTLMNETPFEYPGAAILFRLAMHASQRLRDPATWRLQKLR